MANKILIKRSLNTSVPTSLSNGELAYTSNGNILYIGANGNIEPIGGKRNPGTLTSNQAIVVNANGFIDTIKTNKLVLGPDGTTANLTAIVSNSSLTGVTNTDVATAWAVKSYIDNIAGSSTLQGLTDVTLTSSSNNQILVYDADSLQWENHTVSGTTNEVEVIFSGQDITVGLPNNVTITANLSVSQSLSVTNSATFSNTALFNGTVTANAGLVTTTINANGTVGVTSQFLRSGGASANVYYSGITLGTDTSGSYVESITAGNGITGTGTGEGSTPTIAVNANNGIVSNTSGVFVNAGTGVTVNATGVHIGQPVSTTSNVTFNDLTINGNTILGNATTDLVTMTGRVGSAIVPSANITYNLGTNNLRWNEVHAANIHSTVGYFEQNLEVGGDLIVSGNVVTINVSSISVSDPLIFLASNNSSDLVDIGFVGHYNDSVTNRHAGVARHAATDQFYIFKNYTPEPGSNVIDINHASFRLADINAYLISGGLVSNGTNVSITANSTVAVSIAANSITLSTPLATTSGGTGQNAYTSGDILVANASNILSKLSLGTSGKILQSNGTALIYDDLDGGTF